MIYATDGRNVLTTMANAVLTNLSPCLHEEADTRLLLHAADAVKKGHRKLCVHTNISPCLHEEADTCLLLHAADAVKKGHRKLCVRTVDTDNVVVIAIAMFNQINPDELWLGFGTGSNFSYIPVHEVVSGMNPRNCTGLPVFHAFTECESVSSFGRR